MTFLSGTMFNGTRQCVQIPITDDDSYEENEEFTVLITAVNPSMIAMSGTPDMVNKTIQDNAGRNTCDWNGSPYYHSLPHRCCSRF